MKLNSYFGVDEGDTSYLVDKGDEAYANQLKLFELLENGKDYIVIKAPDDMSQSMSVTLPSEAGSSDYVLTWQDGNIMQWKDVSSISGISELIQVVTDFQKNGFTSVECVSGNCSYDGILDNIGESYPLDLDKGGLGSDLSSPSEDKILFYDESEGRVRWLTVGDNLEIDGTDLDAESGGVFGDTSPSGEVYTGEIYTAGNGLSVSGS